ncbi:hypothetical protein K439DRAFT_1630865 [Ramaria rubella]|nr:hypothetical protein K439DRAFT_1630865 [Ramaria rubella]
MKQEGTAYIKQVKARVQELKEKEIAPHSTFSHVAALFATHTKCVESQLDIIYQLISELSPVRLQLIEENSADVRSHAAKFAKTGRKIKRKAKNVLQGELEQQKLATEAQTYIAQYKHLVQL